jgi:Flp pilus assembly secretin CpaC
MKFSGLTETCQSNTDVRSTTRKEIGEMKKVIMAAAGLALGVCMTAQAGYRTETTVVPGTEAHQYVVQIKIIAVAKDGKMDVLSAPKLTVKAGEEGTLGTDEM